jgi:hypothetical protein
MGRSASGRMRTRVAWRCALSAVAAFAALVVVGASPALAAKRKGDTFSGSCRDQQGTAVWEHPVTWVPQTMFAYAELSGGECSGTLDGRHIRSVPAEIHATLYGPQSCAGGAISGPFEIKLGGHTITGTMTYRRAIDRVTALWQGDGGGQALVRVHGLVGVVGTDSPVAAVPVVGPLVSGPLTYNEAGQQCTGGGMPSAPMAVDSITTVPSLSG